MPSRYWEQLKAFARRGGKLIMDGLTAYYDEHAHCIMKTGFPLADLCGASVKEFKLKGDLFEVKLVNPDLVLPGHCWQGTLHCETAVPIGDDHGEIIACRHAYGQGEVVWVPSLLGLGARLEGNKAFAALLDRELPDGLTLPFRFRYHQPGVLLRILETRMGYLTIIINKNTHPVEVNLNTPEDFHPEVLFSASGEVSSDPDVFHLFPEETLVIGWHKGA